MNKRLKNAVGQVSGTILMLVVALAVGAVLVAISGNSPAEAYLTMLNGAFGSPQKISEVFVKLIPILLMAFGTSIAFRAKLWNIGASGQFIMGSIAATAVALYVDVPFQAAKEKKFRVGEIVFVNMPREELLGFESA